MSLVYYNEIDSYAAQWLRNLIAAGHLPDGIVDERSITNVQPADLQDFDQCHFFAGVGGWPFALQHAHWRGSAWTGSCPCQAHSSAARGRNVAPDLWPAFRRLIVQCRPEVIFGEQVDEAKVWVDGVRADLETIGYEVRVRVLPAYCVAADHVRERIYFAGHSDGRRQPGIAKHAETSWMSRDHSDPGTMAHQNGVSPRVAQLRAYGNAIVPQVAASFVAAFLECRP